MLSSNKPIEQTHTISEGDTSAALPMSVDDEAAAQAIASALSASPDFFNPSSFLTSPVSPWEDDLLTTPAFEADLGMTPDIFTSPVLTDFGGDHDHMPSLFGLSGYEDYDEAAKNFGSTLGPSDLPLPDMDNLYKMSPGTPALDTPSHFPLDFERPSLLGTRKAVPTGTRKNATPESLVPFNAPIQPRKYRTPSATSRKELPVTFARKRARTQGPGDEDEDEVAGPSVSEEDAIKAKRLQNTLAARRSRKRKLEYQRELEEAIEAERKEKEAWRARALILEALLRDKGHEVPQMSEA
jgi:hypothetical protein